MSSKTASAMSFKPSKNSSCSVAHPSRRPRCRYVVRYGSVEGARGPRKRAVRLVTGRTGGVIIVATKARTLEGVRAVTRVADRGRGAGRGPLARVHVMAREGGSRGTDGHSGGGRPTQERRSRPLSRGRSRRSSSSYKWASPKQTKAAPVACSSTQGPMTGRWCLGLPTAG